MPLRLSGLASNMDTDHIIRELMKVQNLKKTKIENKKTKLEWTQDKWKELNTKIYKFYTDQVSRMRLQGSYQTKKATSSNSDIVDVTASTNAPQGSQTLKINQLASTQYTTGARLAATGITTSSKLVDALGVQAGTVINISSGTGSSQKTAVLDVDANTTINDFVQKCREAGLNASYDTTQRRFFISSKESGAENTYTITSSSYADGSSIAYRDNIRNLTSYNSLSGTEKSAIDNALNNLRGASVADMNFVNSGSYDEATATDTQKILKSAMDTLSAAVEKSATTTANTYATEKVKANIKDAIINGTLYNGADYAGVYDVTSNQVWSSLQTTYTSNPAVTLTEAKDCADRKEAGETLTEDEEKLATLYSKYVTELDKHINARVNTDVNSTDNVNEINTIKTNVLNAGFNDGTTIISSLSDLKNVLVINATNLSQASITSGSAGTTNLSKLGLGEIDADIAKDGQSAAPDGSGMVVVKAAGSEIELNGAIITGTTNTIQVNGLTLNLKNTTAVGETLSINVSDDNDAVYKMVKDFVTEYNNLLKEMNTLYYAKTAKGYEPLTDEQRESMTDDQIEKWETKIKESLLRRDNKLGTLNTYMRTAMASSVTVNGKSYSLSSFGIMTSPDYTEKGLLHIHGDKDNKLFADFDDKLRKALSEDPDTVVQVLSGIAMNVYDTMNKSMKTSSLNSALTFYNDKQITKQLKDYTRDISKWEIKLKKMEDKYYKQYAAMETALSKLNQQSASLQGLLGIQ